MAQLVPQEIEFADTAPVTAEGAAVVTGTPEEVWAVLADHQGWPSWFAGVKSCEERFVAWDRAKRWAFTVTDMRPAAVRSLVERITIAELAPGRTRVTYRMAFDPKPWLKPVAPLLARAMSANLTKAMVSLGRQVVERR